MSTAESAPGPVQVVRRSPGRLRLHAPGVHQADARLTRLMAADGVTKVRLNERTSNLLLEFDQSLVDEAAVLALIVAGPPRGDRVRRSRSLSSETGPPAQDGWRRAQRIETIRARPAACIAALTDFERYPEWQRYLTAVTIQQRDKRGRGARVASRALIGERDIQFVTSYRFPSPNRIVFEQADGELEAVRGSWAFRSLTGGRTRAVYVLAVKPGWRLNALLRGSLYEQIRDAVLDHVMSELRQRVELRKPG